VLPRYAAAPVECGRLQTKKGSQAGAIQVIQVREVGDDATSQRDRRLDQFVDGTRETAARGGEGLC